MTLDENLVRALENDYTRAELTVAERTMVEYVVQLTQDATGITRSHHQRLREVGFDDKAILQITLIASWFNYINRVADALGVGRP
ncbi:MAG: carboxymuconolactone decarboxylase family protein [Terriglobales bacterium]